MTHRWAYYDESDADALLCCKWSTKYTCGDRQSPININTGDAELTNFSEPLRFTYVTNDVTKAENDGHTVKFTCGGGCRVTGGPLGVDEYKLVQFHFHWGCDDSKGAEHLLNDVQFPAEMHLVHMNTKYESFQEALKHQDGLCVVGVFLQVGDCYSEQFQCVSDLVRDISSCGSSAEVCGDFNVFQLLPSDTSKFTYYEGSLTTPPLSECVQWLNMLEPLCVDAGQIDVFRHLVNPIGKQLVDNFRPVQSLNGRVVKLSAPSQ